MRAFAVNDGLSPHDIKVCKSTMDSVEAQEASIRAITFGCSACQASKIAAPGSGVPGRLVMPADAWKQGRTA